MSNKTAQMLYMMVLEQLFYFLLIYFYNSKEIEMNIYKKALMPLVALSVPSEIPPSLGGGWIAHITGASQ
jgi:hypothetical protein